MRNEWNRCREEKNNNAREEVSVGGIERQVGFTGYEAMFESPPTHTWASCLGLRCPVGHLAIMAACKLQAARVVGYWQDGHLGGLGHLGAL
jgi:hypothetical protein